jgi:hypothetical protein
MELATTSTVMKGLQRQRPEQARRWFGTFQEVSNSWGHQAYSPTDTLIEAILPQMVRLAAR